MSVHLRRRESMAVDEFDVTPYETVKDYGGRAIVDAREVFIGRFPMEQS
jgi:hypothetical protein